MLFYTLTLAAALDMWQVDGMRRVSVVIPSYNSREITLACLGRLRELRLDVEVIVVDGGSIDGSADAVAEEFPDYQLIRCDNHGWGYATNRGIERAKHSTLLLMNSDLFLTRQAFQAMLDVLYETPKAGAVAPRLINPDGTPQSVFGAVYWPNYLRTKKAAKVPMLTGACLMIPRRIVEQIGGIDENFFLYNEELDLAHRLKDAGYEQFLIPEAVVHIGGASTPRKLNFKIEELRGYLYLSSKHHSPALRRLVRAGIGTMAKARSLIEVEPEKSALWDHLAKLANEGRVLDSLFPLSGRGEVHFSEPTLASAAE